MKIDPKFIPSQIPSENDSKFPEHAKSPNLPQGDAFSTDTIQPFASSAVDPLQSEPANIAQGIEQQKVINEQARKEIIQQEQEQEQANAEAAQSAQDAQRYKLIYDILGIAGLPLAPIEIAGRTASDFGQILIGYKNFGEAVGDIAGDIGDYAQGAVQAFEDLGKAVAQGAGDVAKDFVQGVTNTGLAAAQSADDAAGDAVDAVQTAADNVEGDVNTAADAVGKAVGDALNW